jgi:hypothetical protein
MASVQSESTAPVPQNADWQAVISSAIDSQDSSIRSINDKAR